MTTFIDGPARGQNLSLKTSPKYTLKKSIEWKKHYRRERIKEVWKEIKTLVDERKRLHSTSRTGKMKARKIFYTIVLLLLITLCGCTISTNGVFPKLVWYWPTQSSNTNSQAKPIHPPTQSTQQKQNK